MNIPSKRTLITAALTSAIAPFAHADVVIYDLGGGAQTAFQALGTAFVLGCTALAIGLVVAVVIWKRK